MQHGNTVRWVHSRSLQSDILARCRCHHGDCSAFRSLELGIHWPLQAALSGSLIKAPGFAGGYLLAALLVVGIVALYYVMPPGGREFLVTATFVMIAIVLWAVVLASFVVGK